MGTPEGTTVCMPPPNAPGAIPSGTPWRSGGRGTTRCAGGGGGGGDGGGARVRGGGGRWARVRGGGGGGDGGGARVRGARGGPAPQRSGTGELASRWQPTAWRVCNGHCNPPQPPTPQSAAALGRRRAAKSTGASAKKKATRFSISSTRPLSSKPPPLGSAGVRPGSISSTRVAFMFRSRNGSFTRCWATSAPADTRRVARAAETGGLGYAAPMRYTRMRSGGGDRGAGVGERANTPMAQQLERGRGCKTLAWSRSARGVRAYMQPTQANPSQPTILGFERDVAGPRQRQLLQLQVCGGCAKLEGADFAAEGKQAVELGLGCQGEHLLYAQKL